MHHFNPTADMSILLHTDAIILRSSLYQDTHRILTVFTETEGVIKVFAHHAHSDRSKNFLQPYSLIELIAQKGKGDLYYFKDGTLKLNYFSSESTRADSACLLAAASFSQSILLSQFLEKPSPKLFLLLDLLFKNLPLANTAHQLSSTLQLKILIHDGLLDPEATCSACKQPINQFYLGTGGEIFCIEHRPSQAIVLTQEESSAFIRLAKSRSLEEIIKQNADVSFASKINHFFEMTLQT